PRSEATTPSTPAPPESCDDSRRDCSGGGKKERTPVSWGGKRVEAFDDGLFIGVVRAPAGGAKAVVGDDPRVDEVGHDSRRDVAEAAGPQARQGALQELGRHRGRQRPG